MIFIRYCPSETNEIPFAAGSVKKDAESTCSPSLTNTSTLYRSRISRSFKVPSGPVFTFENAAGLLFKFTSIDAVKEYRPLFFNLSYQLEFLFNWYLLDCMNLWVNVKLQDYFDYPLALSPFAKFGFNIWASPKLNLGFDFTLKFVDMFYSAVYLNENILRFTVKVVL